MAGFESVNVKNGAGILPIVSSNCLDLGHKRCSLHVTDIDHFKLVEVGMCRFCFFWLPPNGVDIFHFSFKPLSPRILFKSFDFF